MVVVAVAVAAAVLWEDAAVEGQGCCVSGVIGNQNMNAQQQLLRHRQSCCHL